MSSVVYGTEYKIEGQWVAKVNFAADYSGQRKRRKEMISVLLDLIKKNGDVAPYYEKIKELTPKILVSWKDINDFLYRLPECDYDIHSLEAVLLAVDGNVRRGREGNGQAKAVLFHLYHDGEYEVLIHDRLVRIDAPKLKSHERYEAFVESDCPDHLMHVGAEDIIPDVYTLDAHDYMMLYLFGTNFGHDADEYPVEEIEDMSAKSFKRAVAYMPVFVDYLMKGTKLHYFALTALLGKIEGAGFKDEQIAEFLRAWINVLEERNIICTDLMCIYLFGQYTYNYLSIGHPTVCKKIDFENKKCFEKAKACLPLYVLWLNEIYSDERISYHDHYDPDTELRRVLGKMREEGYSDEDTTSFATIWMQEMMKHNNVFYSLMYMRLFGEHFSGTRVNIEGIKSFEDALALIPDYLDYIFAYESFDVEYSGKFDPDCELYKFIVKMREHGYDEDKIITFVTHWVHGVEALKKPCNSPIFVYLFNQFVFKRENFKFDLIENKKSFEKALAFVPKWIEYLTDMSVQYHDGYNESDIFDLLINMHGAGYEREKIERFFSKFVDGLASINPYTINALRHDISFYFEKESWMNDYLFHILEHYTELVETHNPSENYSVMF